MEDQYKTIEKPGEGIYKDRGSKFIGIVNPMQRVDEAKELLDSIRKKYHDARHHCYAYRVGVNDEQYRINDDGEPSGSAGKPIYGQILSHEITNVLIVVVRYFGGTKLGVRGLINAYKGASAEAIANTKIVQKYIHDFYRLTFEYPLMSEVMRLLNDERIQQVENLYEANCKIKVGIRKKFSEEIFAKLSGLHGLKVEFLKTF
jgi:uncharacterized YigZ family protein